MQSPQSREGAAFFADRCMTREIVIVPTHFLAPSPRAVIPREWSGVCWHSVQDTSVEISVTLTLT